MTLADASSIPGMIEPIEQQQLFDTASRIILDEDDILIEFGAFFGRSSFCIAEGLMANPRRRPSNRLYVYDNFSCDLQGGFIRHVAGFAKSGAVEDKLRLGQNKIRFRGVFEHYLQRHLASGLLEPVEAELADSQAPAAPIAFMHIDSPKYYTEFKTILQRFFPQLKPSAVVIFQDYFYHWSATLIAAVQLLVEAGVIVMQRSAASALLVEVTQPPDAEQLLRVDRLIQGGDVAGILDRAIAACAAVEIDRREQFLPRLVLAKIQYLWESGDPARATLALRQYLGNGGAVNQPLLNDFFKLMDCGFSIRRLYELDHP